MLKLFFILVLIGAVIFSNKFSKGYLKFLMFILFTTISLRNKICFLDTFSYVEDYDLLGSISFANIPNYWIKDVFFWYIAKIIHSLSNGSYTIWFSFLALCYVIPFYFLLKTYSKDKSISLILFCCLGFALFTMTGLRQTMAMGCTMAALYFLLQSKTKGFIICVILGSLFHITAIVFLILFLIYKVPIRKKTLILFTLLCVIVYSLIIKFIPYIILYEFDGRFEAYAESSSSLNYSGLLQQILIFLVAYFCLGKNRNTPINRILIWMSLIGIFFQSMTNLLPEMFRISMYFSIANLFLLADALSTNKNVVPVKYGVVLVLIVYFVTSKNNGFLYDYYFFFQNAKQVIM